MRATTSIVKAAFRCAVGVVLTVTAINYAAADPVEREPRTFGTSGPPLRYVILGDSTAAGVGGDYEHGIAVVTARELAERRTVAMTNLAVSGAQIADVRKVQHPVATSIRPDVVLLSVGANDVTHLTPIRQVRRELRTIVTALRKANPSVTIVITGSPDMGSPPRIPWLLRG